MSHHIRWAAALLVGLAACKRKDKPSSPAGPAAGAGAAEAGGAQPEPAAGPAGEKVIVGLPVPTTDPAPENEMMQVFRARMDADPDDLDAVLSLARVYRARAVRTGRLADELEAAKLAERAIERQPGLGPALAVRGQARVALGLLGQAAEDLKAAQYHRASGADVLALLVDLQIERGQADKALPNARRIADQAPGTAALVRHGRALLALGKAKEADDVYAAAEAKAASAVERAWVQTQRAHLDVRAGRLPEARKRYEAALAAAPAYREAEAGLGVALAALGETERAETLWRFSVERQPSADLMSALAASWRRRGEAGRADKIVPQIREVVRREIEAFPAAAWAQGVRVHVRHGLADPEVVQWAENNAALRPVAESHRLLAEARLLAGKPAEARAAIDAALARPEADARACWTAARVADAQGDAEAAGHHRTRARELNPSVEALARLDEPPGT